jgi:hypothetical protein
MHFVFLVISVFIFPALAQFKLDPFKGVDPAKVALLSAEDQSRANNEWMKSCEPSDVVFCCWTDGSVKNNPNSQFCPLTDASPPIHCHGTVLIPGRPIEEAMITINYVQVHDHLVKRNYYGNVEGFKSCDCGKNMPIVKRSDVSQLISTLYGTPFEKLDPALATNFNSGSGNDLATTYKDRVGQNAFKSLQNPQDTCTYVGTCTGNCDPLPRPLIGFPADKIALLSEEDKSRANNKWMRDCKKGAAVSFVFILKVP